MASWTAITTGSKKISLVKKSIIQATQGLEVVVGKENLTKNQEKEKETVILILCLFQFQVTVKAAKEF